MASGERTELDQTGAPREGEDHHRHTSDVEEARELNAVAPLNNPARKPSRVVYVPRFVPREPPDSTRLIPLATGRLGVLFSTGPDGRRRWKTPPAGTTWTEAELQALVATERARRREVG